MKAGSKRARQRQYWRGLITQWQRSGMSQRAFAESHKIGPKRLSRWCRRIAAEKGLTGSSEADLPPRRNHLRKATTQGLTAKLVKVPAAVVGGLPRSGAPEFPSHASAPLAVIVDRRYQVVVSDGFAPALLASVIRTLEDLR